MRLLKLILLLVCISTKVVQAQFIDNYGSLQITWPMDNAVFQQDVNGNASVTISAQMLPNSYYGSSTINNNWTYR